MSNVDFTGTADTILMVLLLRKLNLIMDNNLPNFKGSSHMKNQNGIVIWRIKTNYDWIGSILHFGDLKNVF